MKRPDSSGGARGGAAEDGIVALVFGGGDEKGRGAWPRVGKAVVVAVGLYGGAAVVLFASQAGSRPAAPIRHAARVEQRTTDARPIEIAPPPAHPPPPVPSTSTSPAKDDQSSLPTTTRTTDRAKRSVHPRSPARAAAILTRAVDVPDDNPAEAFVSGSAAAAPGGETSAAGQSADPVTGPVDPRATAAPAPASAAAGPPKRARAVRLAEGSWDCPWPAAADLEQIDSETAVVRVHVRPSGSVEAVEIVTDPGSGFGAAAAACARQTAFEPARDAAGVPFAAWSPPIRIHFSR